ncbi:hypothetical protein Pth03_48480 [Planotetraspora thailandica]|uniref:Penicillin-binding protein n=1 Tax=Planotetraspora thailandica TaxID=487172 RepID=A0A8J3V9D2_9ACTN|nr:penicillin-binding transpeptidase domain-containing protein [Planotetraspora thailandica]GII56459.1 hypothetical protein Pth03_48480 [Planotetraspora thailandica]
MGLPGGSLARNAARDPGVAVMPRSRRHAGMRERRVALVSAVVVVMTLAVLVRLWQLQVVNGPAYARAAAAAHVRTVSLPAAQGGVLAADGRPLAAERHHGALAGPPGDDDGADALRTALEDWYGEALTGQAGQRTVSVDTHGAVTRVLAVRAPRPGHSLITNVDGRVQRLAEQVLSRLERGGGGSVVVLEASTGRVIALAGDVVRPRPGESPVIRGVPAGTAAALGLTAPSGIDLPGERTAAAPLLEDLLDGNLLNPSRTAVVLTGPLQLARACAAVANGGTLFSPRVARALVRVDGRAGGEPGAWTGRVVTPPVAGRIPAATLHLVRDALTGPSAGRGTGGAETGVITEPDWSASFGPKLRFVVVVVISHGDAGGAARELQKAAAAPARTTAGP